MLRVIALIFAAVLAAPAVAQNNGYPALVKRAKQTIVKDFKDPEGARFRDIGIYKSTTGKGGVSVCGEVNAKNSYGAYVGYRSFFVSGDMAYINDEENAGMYGVLGPALCHERVASVK